MNDDQRQATIARLQAKWDALPPKVRQALLEKKRQRREAKLMRQAEARGNSSGYGSQPAQQ